MSNTGPSKNSSIRTGGIDYVLGSTSTIVALLKDISFLIPLAGPLAQVLAITKELLITINEMRDNGEAGSYFAERILKRLKDLSEESRLNSLPTALRLAKLES